MRNFLRIMGKGEVLMKGNNGKSFLIITGVIILCVFSYVVASNLVKDTSGDSFYARVEGAKIEDVRLDGGNLIVNTSGGANRICVKTTKSIPSDKSLCFKDVDENRASFSIYQGKIYYIWVMDNSGKISDYAEFNTNLK